MRNILVLYKSKYGSAKKYAVMIKEEIPCDIFNINSYDCKDLTKYDCIVIASGIYAGGISGIKFLKKHLKILMNKKIIFFAVGASPFDKTSLNQIKIQNFKNIPMNIPVFYGRGAYDENKMTWKDKTYLVPFLQYVKEANR